jgi:hypothetical protein
LLDLLWQRDCDENPNVDEVCAQDFGHHIGKPLSRVEKASRRSSKGRENLRAKIEKDVGVGND